VEDLNKKNEELIKKCKYFEELYKNGNSNLESKIRDLTSDLEKKEEKTRELEIQMSETENNKMMNVKSRIIEELSNKNTQLNDKVVTLSCLNEELAAKWTKVQKNTKELLNSKESICFEISELKNELDKKQTFIQILEQKLASKNNVFTDKHVNKNLDLV